MAKRSGDARPPPRMIRPALLLEFMTFGVGGMLGFLVDTGVLYLLKGAMGLYYARVVSFLFAVLTTWLFNRTVTFARRTSNKRPHREFGYYLAFMLGGGCVNYVTYALLVYRVSLVAEVPVIGVAAGSLAGMVVNFSLARLILFRHDGRR